MFGSGSRVAVSAYVLTTALASVCPRPRRAAIAAGTRSAAATSDVMSPRRDTRPSLSSRRQTIQASGRLTHVLITKPGACPPSTTAAGRWGISAFTVMIAARSTGLYGRQLGRDCRSLLQIVNSERGEKSGISSSSSPGVGAQRTVIAPGPVWLRTRHGRYPEVNFKTGQYGMRRASST